MATLDHVCTYAHTHARIRARAHTHMYTTHMHSHTHTCTHARAHTHTHARTHTNLITVLLLTPYLNTFPVTFSELPLLYDNFVSTSTELMNRLPCVMISTVNFLALE